MKNFWKKTAAGIMTLLIVAGASPVQPITQFAQTAVMNASTTLAYYALISTTTGEVPTLKEFARPKEL
jgi:hypothetical protein